MLPSSTCDFSRLKLEQEDQDIVQTCANTNIANLISKLVKQVAMGSEPKQDNLHYNNYSFVGTLFQFRSVAYMGFASTTHSFGLLGELAQRPNCAFVKAVLHRFVKIELEQLDGSTGMS